MKKKTTILKVISAVLVLIFVLSMISCETKDINDVDGVSSGDIKDVVSNDNGQATDDDTSKNEETSKDTDKTEIPKSHLSIEEKVLFEYNGLVVSAKEIVEDTILGTGIKVLVENNSDKDYSIGVEQAIVNNCMIADLFSCSIAAGKKANEKIYLSSSDLRAAGINNIGQVELYFYVYDSTTYERLYETDCITIKTSDYDVMDTTVDNAGHTLYDANGVKIIGKYVDEYKMLGKAIVLQIVNNRNENIGVSCDDMSINGYMITPVFSSTVYSGKFTIDEITILRSDLEENGIAEINTFALKFNIYNADTYQSILKTDELSFNAK